MPPTLGAALLCALGRALICGGPSPKLVGMSHQKLSIEIKYLLYSVALSKRVPSLISRTLKIIPFEWGTLFLKFPTSDKKME